MSRINALPLVALAGAALALVSAPAIGALAKGVRAPLFTAKGAIAGKPVTVNLASALKKGPVVLYFFPAAFTPGCNVEANAFAAAVDDFRKAGATVIGMTAGNIDQIEAFSAEKCAGKFAVAAASSKLIASYDVPLTKPDGTKTSWSDRTTYVIGRDGRIAFTYSDMKPNEHITQSLAAVRSMAKK